MRLNVIGINHNSAAINIREKLAISDRQINEFYNRLKSNPCILECLLLSTCNRMEVYFVSNTKTQDAVLNCIKEFHNIEEDLKPYIYYFENINVVKHLYRVASGLDSMVIGEDQILGQVKDAYKKAVELKVSGSILNKLFLYGITTAKKIKTNIRISEESISISSIGIKLLKAKYSEIKNKKIFIIGLGEMSMLIIKNLVREGVKEIYIANRSHHKMIDFKKNVREVIIVPYEEKYKYFNKCDIGIVAARAPHYILDKIIYKEYFDKERHICLIDLSLPRNIDPELSKYENVSIYSLDDLKGIAKDNAIRKKEKIIDAERFIEKEIEKYICWYYKRIV